MSLTNDGPIRPRTRLESVVGIINWEILREQKTTLLELSMRPDLQTPRFERALMGMVNLLDAIQDAAAEDLGEVAVFGDLEERENAESPNEPWGCCNAKSGHSRGCRHFKEEE